jgi:hypothetical protein
VGKWIFLWVVLAEAGSLVIAMIMRYMGDLEGRSVSVSVSVSDLTSEHTSTPWMQSCGQSVFGSWDLHSSPEKNVMCVPVLIK